tara:strand:+ start:3957 stop:4415 length:459 start_codon:yes stop_codon:yes gene_type:complete
MADSNLQTSTAAILSRITTLVASSDAKELAKNAKTGKNIGEEEDTSLEQAVASRVSSLSSSATAEDLDYLSRAVKELLSTTSSNLTGEFIPSQSGNSGKFLVTDGTNDSWQNVSIKTVTNVVDLSNSASYNIAYVTSINKLYVLESGNWREM